MPDTNHRETFAFAPARRQGVGLFVGVAGGTGSGKTYSALRLARGIAGPDGKIAAIDTEARRMSHYADQFNFDVTDMAPPFRPERFAQAAEDAERAGYAVLVIDSFSLEWTGEGGVLAMHDAIAGDDPKKNMSAWIKPKSAHKAMIASFLQRRIPLVFCFRAEEKVKVGPGGRPEPLGWMPIGDSRFMFELTTMLTLSNEAPGRVSYNLPRRIQEQHLGFFPDGQPITERAGEQLAAWARGDDVKPADKPAEIADALITAVNAAATEEALLDALAGDTEAKQMAWLKAKRPELYKKVNDASDAKRKALLPA
jgi:AAA domain